MAAHIYKMQPYWLRVTIRPSFPRTYPLFGLLSGRPGGFAGFCPDFSVFPSVLLFCGILTHRPSAILLRELNTRLSNM